VDPDDFAERVSGVAALADPIRRDLYLYVAAQPEPVSRDAASAGVGVPRPTVKFHLDKLVEQGLLATEFKRLSGRSGPGAGRPTKLYKRSALQVSVSLPERRYDLAGRLMARAIDDSIRDRTAVVDTLHQAAADFGVTLAETVGADAGPAPTDAQVVTSLCAGLAHYGYEPRREPGIITLVNCPFDALAREYTELVCGMNLALLDATARHSAATLTARLDPEAGRCCVVLDT
jgi:predicted ArsR family transcriptional regulator